ncbi:MAG: LysE family transporter [Candidatus Kapaibacteriales bacterium]
MLSIIPGIIVGIILALPPGPAALTAIKLGLSNSWRHGFLSGFGTAVMDFIYCLIAIFATNLIIDWASKFSNHHPLISLAIQMLIIFSIIYLGLLHFKSAKLSQEEKFNNPSVKFSIDKLSVKGPFFVGIAIALTNIANPTFLPSLGYVAIHIQKFGFIEFNTISNIFFALGFGIGNLIWLVFLVHMFVSFKHKMSERFIAQVHKFTGLTLIGFGTFLGFRLLEVVKWSEIFRFVFPVF